MSKILRIGIVAGEASGDILGASLIKALKLRHPDAIFEGIGGPLMQAQGFTSLVPMERLSVMGLVEVLGRLRELFSIRSKIFEHFMSERPDIFIGIDAPDFTLPLERKLKQEGLKTLHYVSPSVWAWRQGRIHKIAKSVDHMLCLLPFEAEFYAEHNVPVSFVGHPLADEIPLEPQPELARKSLGLENERSPIIALLPGSRQGELARIAPLFLEAASLCKKGLGKVRFIIPCVNKMRKQQMRELIAEFSAQHAIELDIQLLNGRSHEAMAAADGILIASGTATLEAMLLKRPMVLAYKLSPFTFWLASKMVRVPYVGLPNLLAKRFIIPELLQNDATPEAMAQKLLQQMNNEDTAARLADDYLTIHQSLKRNASERAADAVCALIEG